MKVDNITQSVTLTYDKTSANKMPKSIKNGDKSWALRNEILERNLEKFDSVIKVRISNL